MLMRCPSNANFVIILWLIYGSLALACGQNRKGGSGMRGKNHDADYRWVDYDEDEDWNNDDDDYEAEREYDNTFRTLLDDGNVTVPSRACSQNQCEGSWGAWQSWTGCDMHLPGSNGPQCHNTLHLRKRFCAQRKLCFETLWEYCVHKPSCVGEWSPWSEYEGNCSVGCTSNQTRNRMCYHNGSEAPGLCYGSGTTAIETDVITCSEDTCKPFISSNLRLGLLIGFGILLLVIVVAVTSTCIIRAHKQNKPQETSLVSSSSFLLGQWRVISRRFRRRTHSEPQQQNNEEVAIGSNYSAIHVYESPNDYSRVFDSAEGNVYEETLGAYRMPFSGIPARSRVSTAASVEKYAVIGCANAYASMEPGGSLSQGDFREIRRSQSCDNVVSPDRNLNRPRPLPGTAVKVPVYRGASQLPGKKNMGLIKKTSNANGVLARITKKRKITMERRTNAMHSSLDFSLEEDRYGYLVPNSNGPGNRAPWQRQKTKTFSGVAASAPTLSAKSASLPADIDTYVTMKVQKDRASAKGYSSAH